MLVLLAVGSVSDISAFIVLVAIGFVVWLISDSSSSRKPRTMKYCQQCAEPVRARAKLCKHCGSAL